MTSAGLEDGHRQEVERIAALLREKTARGEQVHITKSSGHHVVPIPGDPRFRNQPIDISALRRILSLDPGERRCVVEPGVTFRELVTETLAHGLIPAVVPELEGITVGGAVAGCSIEAMSYRVGGFHDNCLAYEIITGDGRVVTCSPEEEPHLFEMIHGSYGTLGILSRIELRLLPARPFVRLEYLHLQTLGDFEAALYDHCRKGDVDFIDAIIHGRDHFVLCLGRFVDTAPYTSDYRRTRIYYRSTRTRREDYLATADYCFRYDADCHWMTRTAPPLEWRPVRWLLGRHVLGSTNLIRWSNRLSRILALKKRPEVVVDVFIPDGNFAPFFRWYEETFDYWPLWVVPYRLDRVYPWVHPEHARRMKAAAPHNLSIDCAVYGKSNSDPDVDYSQLLEEKTYELHGFKTLISRNHYTEERFWRVYDQAAYRTAKAALDPTGTFPDVFEKFHRVG